YRGSPTEDPNSHLKSFLDICGTVKINGVSEDAIRLRLFPFSLQDKARDWLQSIPPGSITTWDALVQAFLKKFFPPAKTVKLRTEIGTFQQQYDEQLFEAWERFKELLRKCPHHGYPDWLQVQLFYNGLTPSTKTIVDAAAGGTLLSKTVENARTLLEDMATNSYQWPSERSTPKKIAAGVFEVDKVSALQAQMTSLANAFIKFSGTGSAQSIESAAALASRPQEETIEQVQYVSNSNFRGYNNNSTPTHYHPNNRNHENFSYANTKNVLNPPGFAPQTQENKKLEDLVGAFIAESSNRTTKLEEAVIAINSTVNGHSAAIKNIETQLGQLVNVVSTMNKGKAPAEQEKPQMEYCKAITVHQEESEEEPESEDYETPTGEAEEDTSSDEAEKPNLEPPIPSPTLMVPKEKKKKKKKKNNQVQFDKFMNAFMNLNINIPFAEALEMPQYNRFMKEWLAKKRKEKKVDTVYLASTCSTRVQQKVPEKVADPGSFSVPCSFGTYSFRALCDLGASINIIPLSLCKKLDIGEIKSTPVKLQLADQSVVRPVGIVENVLIRVGRFFLPIDLYVMDMIENPSMPVILGRPFLATGRVIIDIERRELTIRVKNEKEIFKAVEDSKDEVLFMGYRKGARKSTSVGFTEQKPP
ncbi:retropepsin-like aspartic protease family protein, partial [Salmonella enterica]|nr:retropepsin-like aspartic protease family protein [Salmonella enterica]